MNQLSKENINLVRLINRLERNPSLLQPPKQPRIEAQQLQLETSDKNISSLSTFEREDNNRYWELKALETTIRHARSILDTIYDSQPNTLPSGRQIDDPSDLRAKLERIRVRIDAALKTCPAPPITRLARSRPATSIYNEIKRPEAPTIPPKKNGSSEKAAENEPTPGKKEADECDEKPDEPGEKSARFGRSPPQPTNLVTSNQEELTDELAQMAVQLKKNVHHFNKLLVADHAILLANQTKLELNADSMSKEGGRLGLLRLKTRSLTWFSILAVIVVAVSWILMFIIIRLS
ncbi:hypothetical protein PGT21_027041 [Puccinia graminis f. sp. tritici]|uniref:Uncharacterized protein n=1 Tax=Puccinia graminis f. sp. tritici TaxID=56615 RepID=A0A5B0NVE4_PUCGR|nr:hypothetical protein PGT21_027041 [Puccinia graminis f. sp. tritici]